MRLASSRRAPFSVQIRILSTVRLLSGLSLFLGPAGAVGQSAAIELTHLVTLGSVMGEESFLPMGGYVAFRGGRYFVHGFFNSSEFYVYNESGELLEAVGKEGDGPGEFRDILSLEVSEDGRVHIIDATARRLTVLSPSYELESTLPLPFRPTGPMTLLADGRKLISGVDSRYARAGYLVHLLDGEDDATPLALSADPVLSDGDSQYRWHGGLSGDSAFWTARQDRVEFELWGFDNKLLKRVAIRRPWLDETPVVSERLHGRSFRSPQPAVIGMKVDDVGRAWIIGRTADPDWRDGVSEAGYSKDQTTYFDFVLEVIDLETGVVLASHRSDEHFFVGFLSGDRVSSFRDRELGFKVIDVWRLELNPTGGTE